ncbi:MAG: hypothetical protein ABI397_00910 [Candidatus Saccharimonas sp.]
MTERPKPYIGVSGVVDTEQQRFLLDQFAQQNIDDARHLALGVKVVHKTQYLDVANKYGPEWYPVGESALASALEPYDRNSLRVAQVYFDVEHVGDEGYRNKFMERIRRRGAAWLTAVQFDMLPWHRDSKFLDFIENVKSETGFKVLLQAHGEAMNELGPNDIVCKLGGYASALDYILFDASHGNGVQLDTHALRPFLEAAYNSNELSGVGIGIAGGLNAEVVRQDLPELLADYPDLSWDAEGQLHPVGLDGKRPLDMEVTSRYLEASAAVLRSV